MQDHLSPSQINRFIAEPAMWLIEHFHGVRSEAGPAAWRGSAIEVAADAVLFNAVDDDQALDYAYRAFDTKAQGEVRDDIDKARAEIPAYLRNLLPTLRELGTPLSRQARISLNLAEFDTEIVGYVDYRWSDHLIDLKTTARMPSLDAEGRLTGRADHLRQMAIYHRAEAVQPRLLYVTPGKPDKDKDRKEPLLYTPSTDELESAFRHAAAAVRAMERIRRSVENGRALDEIVPLYPPRDLDSYVWDDVTRRHAIKLWNL